MDIELFFLNNKPLFTVLHVLCVVFGMGAALMSDVLFNFYAKDKELSETEVGTLSLLSKIVLWSLPLIILSGLAIFMSDIQKYTHSVKFLVKMTIMCVLIINGIILEKYIWSHLLKKKFFTAHSEKWFRQVSFICGMISVVSWIFICTLGVLDKIALSYEILFGIYLGILLCGIPIALFIEHRTFERK